MSIHLLKNDFVLAEEKRKVLELFEQQGNSCTVDVDRAAMMGAYCYVLP